jgi:hypothetical protein
MPFWLIMFNNVAFKTERIYKSSLFKKVLIISSGIIMFVIIVGLGYFHLNREVKAQSAKTEPTPIDIIEVLVRPKKDFTAKKMQDTIQTLEYSTVSIKSKFKIGTEEQFDFLIKTDKQKSDVIENDLDVKRLQFLHNLEFAPSESKAKKEVIQIKPIEIVETRNKLATTENNIEEAKFVVKKEKKEKLKNDLSLTDQFLEIIEIEIKEKTEAPAVQEQKKSLSLNSIVSPIRVDAQSYYPPTGTSKDWQPDYGSVNFFDLAETGVYLHREWSYPNQYQSTEQPSVTYGNEKMYVGVRGLQGDVWIGIFEIGSGALVSWNQVPGGINTPSSPTVEFYYGRLYVGIQDYNNRTLIRNSNYFNSNGTVASWTNWNDIGGLVPSGFDMEAIGNDLYIGARGMQNRIHRNRMSNGTNAWQGWELLGNGQTYYKPVLAQHNGKLYFGVNDINDKPHVNIQGNGAWSDSNWRQIKGFTPSSFGMASIGNQLCFLFRNYQDDLSQGCSGDHNLGSFPPLIFANANSKYGPTLGKFSFLAQVIVGTREPILLQDSGNAVLIRQLGTTGYGRGFLTEMIWFDGSSGFYENSTFESKISLGNGANSNYQNYLGKNDTNFPHCMPIIQYYISNLPHFYLDTRVQQDTPQCDSNSLYVGYTIGSSYPKQIVQNKRYYTYWIDTPGQLYYPRYELRFQRGENRPDWCAHYTMCLGVTPYTKYWCNSSEATFCGWFIGCETACEGDWAWFVEDSANFTKNGNYWYRSFFKK